MSFTCRPATDHDTTALLGVHRAAFATDVEADLVAELLRATAATARQSWVADSGGTVVGHVLLTGGDTGGEARTASPVGIMLLCPLAVLPSHQHAGVGTTLVRAALAAAGSDGIASVTVFGDPAYYSRFGFRSLLPAGPQPAFDVGPAHRDAWQTLYLGEDQAPGGLLDGVRPVWPAPLMRPELWQV